MNFRHMFNRLLGRHGSPPRGWHPPEWSPEFARTALDLVNRNFPSHVEQNTCVLGEALRSVLKDILPYAKRLLNDGGKQVSWDLKLECNRGDLQECESSPRRGRVSVSHGFMFAAYQSASILTAAMPLEEDAPPRSLPTTDLSRRLYRVLDACSRGLEVPVVISLSDLTATQLTLSAALTYWAERFAVAHELGHVMIERLASNYDVLDETRRFVVEMTRKHPVLAPPGRGWIEAWSEEIACDHLGLITGMEDTSAEVEARGPAILGIVALPPAGAELILELHNQLRPLTATPSPTHPPFELRINFMRELWAKHPLCQLLWMLGEANTDLLRTLAARSGWTEAILGRSVSPP
jgi:hypothetical protein